MLALHALTNSQCFAKSENLRKFIAYIVEKTLVGEHTRISAVAVAMDVFGRAASFDPQNDPIVRVQAGRLRNMLLTYYTSEGAGQRVQITVPKGAYVPEFWYVAEPSVTQPPGGQERRSESNPDPVPEAAPAHAYDPGKFQTAHATRHVRGDWRLALVGLASLVAVGGALWRPSSTPEAPRSTATSDSLLPSREPSLPRIHVQLADGTSQANLPILESFKAEVVSALGQFDEIIVDTAASAASAPAGAMTYALRLSASSAEAGHLNILAVLENTSDTRFVWSSRTRFDPAAKLDELGRSPGVRPLAANIASAYGVTYADIFARSGPVASKSCATCVRVVHDYFDLSSQPNFARAMACLDQEVSIRPELAFGHALRAVVLAKAHDKSWMKGKADTLDDAAASAREAIRLRPTSAQAHRALMHIHAARNAVDAAIDEGRLALTFNPDHPLIKAEFGVLLAENGQFAEGARSLTQAQLLTPSRPPTWDFGLFVAANGLRDLAGANSSGVGLIGLPAPAYEAAAAISSHRRGDRTQAMASLQALAGRPGVQADVSSVFAERNFAPAVKDQVVADLMESGMADVLRIGTSR